MKPELEIRVELEGWKLYTAHVELTPHDREALDRAVHEGVSELVTAFADRPLSQDPVVKAVRKQFRRLGSDPTRHRPSFEALGRRLLKGNPLPRIHPLVDVINLLSLRLRVPVCVVDTDRVAPPLVLAAGPTGSSFESLKGRFNSEKKPALFDRDGIVGTPIVDAERVKVTDETRQALLYVYVPEATAERVPAEEVLAELLESTKTGRLISDQWITGP